MMHSPSMGAVGLCFSFVSLTCFIFIVKAHITHDGGSCNGILDGRSTWVCLRCKHNQQLATGVWEASTPLLASSAKGVFIGGIYDTIFTSKKTVSFLDIKDAVCSQLTDYSYNDYLKDKYKSLTDRSHVDKGYCKSRAYKVDLGASVIDLLPFLGKGSYSDDLKTCEELATSNLISNSNQFKEAQSGVSNAAYFYCSSQQGGKIDADESQMVKKIASSAVVDAYNKCLDANKQGLQTAVTYPSSDRTSVVVTIKFVYQFSGKGAEISGYSVKPDGAATCKLHGEGINSQAAITMKHVPLEDEQAYSITCKLGNTKRGDIRILTSVGPIVVTIVDRTNIDKPKPALPVSHLLRSRALLSSTKGTWNPVAPASGLSAPASTTEQKTFSDTFHFPTYQGLALDWCMDIGQTCGPQVAETFCKARGYDKASFDGPYKLAFGKTLTLRTEKSCEEPGKCYGFKSITCTGAATRFYYPRHNSGELYDICVTFGHRCNAEAIDAICIDKGFVHSFGFSGPFTVSYTLTVQDHEICDEPHGCGAFIFLDCINTIPYGAGTPRDRVQASMSG